MSDEQKNNQQLVATWASFIAICVGIGTMLMQMGRRDAQLVSTVEQVRELGSIVSELAKAQVAFTLTDKQTEERLRELTSRLERLERTTK